MDPSTVVTEVHCEYIGVRRYTFLMADGSTRLWSNITLAYDVHRLATFMAMDKRIDGKTLREQVKAALDMMPLCSFPMLKALETPKPITREERARNSDAAVDKDSCENIVKDVGSFTPPMIDATADTVITEGSRPPSFKMVTKTAYKNGDISYEFKMTNGSVWMWSDITSINDVRSLASFLYLDDLVTGKSAAALREKIKSVLDEGRVPICSTLPHDPGSKKRKATIEGMQRSLRMELSDANYQLSYFR